VFVLVPEALLLLLKVACIVSDRRTKHHIHFQYEAMTTVGYRDDKESFLVDFEQKRWDNVSSPAQRPLSAPCTCRGVGDIDGN